MRVGSLFSGIGGFDLGLERAGMEIAWQSEIDPFCNRVLARHWPGVRNYGDITQIDPTDLEPVDLVCGGFPCQDLSVAGRRAGLAGARSGLWWEFHRILAGLRPAWVVIENVPGLLSSNGGRDMGALLRSLGDLGYGWAYRVLDAQWFGLAQRRKRVFIVGCLGDAAGPAQVLFEPESCAWNPPPRREAGADVAYAIAAGAGGSKFGSGRDGQDTFVTQALTGTFANGGADDNKAQAGFLVAGTLGAGPRGHRHDLDSTGAYIAHTLRAEAHDAGEDGTGRGVPLVIHENKDGNLAAADHARALRSGASHSYQMVAAPLTASYAKQVDNSDRNGGPPNVLCTGMTVRRLTPRECERLQGFPDGWTCLCDAKGDTMRCICPDSPRYRALGNAVAVPVASWIGRRILAVEATNNTRAEAR